MVKCLSDMVFAEKKSKFRTYSFLLIKNVEYMNMQIFFYSTRLTAGYKMSPA